MTTGSPESLGTGLAARPASLGASCTPSAAGLPRAQRPGGRAGTRTGRGGWGRGREEAGDLGGLGLVVRWEPATRWAACPGRVLALRPLSHVP